MTQISSRLYNSVAFIYKLINGTTDPNPGLLGPVSSWHCHHTIKLKRSPAMPPNSNRTSDSPLRRLPSSANEQFWIPVHHERQSLRSTPDISSNRSQVFACKCRNNRVHFSRVFRVVWRHIYPSGYGLANRMQWY